MRDEALELATNLLSRAGTPTAKSAASIAEEARGHPLFMAELAQARAVTRRATSTSTTRCGRACRGSTSARAPGHELVAVAGAPVALTTAARATGESDRSALTSRAALLRAESLLRTARGGGAERVEAYHDRVREAVLARLDDETCGAAGTRSSRPRSKRRETLIRPPSRSTGAARAPSTRPRTSRSWPHRTPPLRSPSRGPPPWRVPRSTCCRRVTPTSFARRPSPAEALANAGRGPDAASHYLAAAAMPAPEEEAVDLRRRAAEQLLRSGHIDEGLDAMSDVLRAVGLHLPRTPRLAMAALLWNKARLIIRGRRFTLRSADSVPPLELRRVDACWSVTLGLSLVDIVRAADFQARTLRLALDAGEPGRLARSLAMASGFATHEGGVARRRAPELLREAERLAEVHHDPYASAWLPFRTSDRSVRRWALA